jgi:MFS family permease
LAGAFVAHALRRERPVLDLRLFGTPAYAAACVAAAFAGAAMFGSAVLFPLYFRLGRGADPLGAGLLLVSASIGTALVLPVSGRLVDRFGGGAVAVVGAALREAFGWLTGASVLGVAAACWLAVAERGPALVLERPPGTSPLR